jgi:tryptophanyl-tRNA synthetase
MTKTNQKRLLSGIKPTGKSHIGNYFGAIKNWISLQDNYQNFIMIADYHALTTHYESKNDIRSDSIDLAIDLIACGIDPQKSAIFIQSEIEEHAKLHLILSMITPTPWLLRVPTYKSQKEELKTKNLDTYGFLGYPVLQAADILLYETDIVPVGKDQLPHLELTREIARRFNHIYGDTFKEPKDMLSNISILPGTNGKKMSKSYNNTIELQDKNYQEKILKMLTDTSRQRRTDKGDPSKCPAFSYHELFTSPEATEEISNACKNASIGCFDCKKKLAISVGKILDPIQEKREQLLKNTGEIKEILNAGNKQAKATAKKTYENVAAKLNLS